MADLKARRVNLSYEGGTATTALGNWEYLFGGNIASWSCPTEFPVDSRGRRRLGKGSNQKKRAAGGRIAYAKVDNGQIITIRYSGAFVDFVKNVVCRAGSKIIDVWTQRGTEVGPDEFLAIDQN